MFKAGCSRFRIPLPGRLPLLGERAGVRAGVDPLNPVETFNDQNSMSNIQRIPIFTPTQWPCWTVAKPEEGAIFSLTAVRT